MKIDYSSELKKINNQKNTSSCTSNALSTILSFIIYRQGCYYFQVSILYIYYHTRYLQGNVFKDNGSIPIIALQAIEKYEPEKQKLVEKLVLCPVVDEVEFFYNQINGAKFRPLKEASNIFNASENIIRVKDKIYLFW